MTRVAVTGHRGLSEDTARLVEAGVRAAVGRYEAGGLVGVSCIADGADALFAEAVLDVGGSLVVVVPARRYRDSLPKSYRATYDVLLSRAVEVVELGHVESTSDAHMDASLRMLEGADELVAVWDGQPARGYGGTADVVAVARERGMRVVVVWPDGAARA